MTWYLEITQPLLGYPARATTTAGDGNLAILVSALAQPLRPWALGAAGGAGPAEEFLPGQLLLRRASGAWVERLTEGAAGTVGRCRGLTFGQVKHGEASKMQIL